MLAQEESYFSVDIGKEIEATTLVVRNGATGACGVKIFQVGKHSVSFKCTGTMGHSIGSKLSFWEDSSSAFQDALWQPFKAGVMDSVQGQTCAQQENTV